jgi:Methyltransferase domain
VLGPVLDACLTPLEMYGEGDSEKRACGLRVIEAVMPKCVVFSIGSNDEWGFEEAIFRRTNCTIETFDCTVNVTLQPPHSIRSRTRLHRVCLGRSDEVSNGNRFVTWSSLLALVGMAAAPSFLKIDIEGYEFQVLRSIIEHGEFLPMQIAIELHYATDEAIFTGRKSSAELYAFMNYLHAFGGYHLIDRHDNADCPHCSELLLARLTCGPSELASGGGRSSGLLRKQKKSPFKRAYDEFCGDSE